jgi:hypothetical protein
MRMFFLHHYVQTAKTVRLHKIWIIPADVEPIAVGDHPVTYTHYDPKTKRETVHFYPQRQ